MNSATKEIKEDLGDLGSFKRSARDLGIFLGVLLRDPIRGL